MAEFLIPPNKPPVLCQNVQYPLHIRLPIPQPPSPLHLPPTDTALGESKLHHGNFNHLTRI